MMLHDFFNKSRECWCRGALAKDRHGNTVSISSPNAVSFCLAGAVYVTYGPHCNSVVAKLLQTLRANPEKYNNTVNGLAHFNDTATYEQLMELLKTAAV